MNHYHIVSSVTNGFSNLYTGNVDWSNPNKFDAEADELDHWAVLTVTSIDLKPRRKGNQILGTINVQAVIEARTQYDLYACEKIASKVMEILEHWDCDIRDFEDSAEPVIGIARFGEPRLLGDDSPKDSWQRRRVEISATIQSL